MADLEQYLIARVLPHAYDARPGRPKPRFSEQQGRQALAFLARQMNQDHTRDLAWWQIPRWASTGPRMLASMLASGLLGAILGGLGFVLDVIVVVGAHGVKQSLWTVLWYALVQGLAFGLGVGLSLGIWFGRGGREPKRVREPGGPSTCPQSSPPGSSTGSSAFS
ncbi:MAG: hypothetical protein JO115_01200 [Pseudonocardiales bacterium]|nr:hypothetical protein [Pseudonocardiales bacterium]